MKERHMEMFASKCWQTGSSSSSVTSFETNLFTSDNLSLSLSHLLFFFFSFSLFLRFHLFSFFFVSFREKLMRFRGTKFREMNETGDLSRRDEINDLSWWVWRGNGRNKNRKFWTFDLRFKRIFVNHTVSEFLDSVYRS